MRRPACILLLVATLAAVGPTRAEPPVTGVWRLGGFRDVALLSLFAPAVGGVAERELAFACGADPAGIGVMMKGGPVRRGPLGVVLSGGRERLRLRLKRVDAAAGQTSSAFIYPGLAIDRIASLLQGGAGLSARIRGSVWIRAPAGEPPDVGRFVALCRLLAAKGREMRE